MKRMFAVLILFFSLNFAQAIAQSDVNLSEKSLKMSDLVIFNIDNKYGLKDKKGNIITEAQYQKLIRLGESSWIVQKKNKFGLIDNSGKVIIEPKYRHVERVFQKFVKFGNVNDYGLYNEKGEVIIPAEYSSIEPLFGKMFLTCKHYKYGVSSDEGKVLLSNSFEDIYMPTPKTMRVKFNGEWYELEKWQTQDEIGFAESENTQKVTIGDNDVKITLLAYNTGVISGYSALTATDYLIKLLSSISPAYEQTIDELMLSQGAETVSIFMKLGWIPKFPVTYMQKYYRNIVNPNNGPLSDTRKNLKKQMK